MDGPVGRLTNPFILGSSLACTELGSSSLTWVFSVLVFACHTQTHTHILSCSAYHPHVGKNNCSCYRSLLSRYYKRETPCLSQASLYAPNGPAKKKYHLFRPSKGSTRRPHTKSVKLSEIFAHFLRGWNVFCVPVNSDVTMNVPLCLCSTVGRCQMSWHTAC